MYQVLKKCRINGRDYVKDDVVNADELRLYEGERLIQLGFLIRIAGEKNMITLFADTEPITPEQVLLIMDILQSKQAEAIEKVENLKNDADNRAVLEILSKVDNRAKVRDACI
ncbi:MAG: hypothetical protein Q4G33_04575 [bacterium]|nr:hypothetical protein [bacterium]